MSGIIGAGAITRSGVLGAFPAGHIIQCGHETHSGTIQDGTAGTGIAVTDLEVSMTAINTNGKYFIICFSPYTSANYGNNSLRAGFQRDENGAGYVTHSGHKVFTKTGGTYNGYGFNSLYFNYLYTASITAGQNIKFRPYYERNAGGGSDTIFSHTDIAPCTLTVFELEPFTPTL